jgi:hypothetical protein
VPKFPQERQIQGSDGPNFSEDKIDCTKNGAMTFVIHPPKERGELRCGGYFLPN